MSAGSRDSTNRRQTTAGAIAGTLLFALLILRPDFSFAQLSTATVAGVVVDQSGSVLSSVIINLKNADNGVQRHATSDHSGGFALASLAPGRYVLTASLAGFSQTELRDIAVNVGERIDLRVAMRLASRDEDVTVVAEVRRLNTASAVGTTIDRRLVENLPLNGRSFQALLELTPGVTLTRVGSTTVEGGQFNVNGQRSNANSFMIDGVAAPSGISSSSTGLPGQSGSGQLPAMTALGGTNGLVSVDALQEFRVQTSGYAPEFGRTSGGQISIVTKSGSNTTTGTTFESFRHDALDANDWFANSRSQPKAKLRQHDFGGVLGGPVLRKRTFYFVSYEGLRLEQPRSMVVPVPTLTVREAATLETQPYLNALPIPNGAELGGGFAQFAATFSDPSRLDSTSVRLDQNVAGSLSMFVRGSYAPSYRRTRSGSLSYFNTVQQNSTAFTIGGTWVPHRRVVHDLRFNVSRTTAPYRLELDTFGGATPIASDAFYEGRTPANSFLQFAIRGGGGWLWGVGTDFQQSQFNLVDSVTLTASTHEIKIGADWRRTRALFNSGGSSGASVLIFNIADLSQARANVYQNLQYGTERSEVPFDSVSTFIQDNWKLSSRTLLTYGIRWEFVPPPRTTFGDTAVTLDDIENPYGGNVSLAPRNTPLWRSRYNNFAPRFGLSYVLSERPGAELVVKGGLGSFYDLGLGQIASAFRVYPFVASKVVVNPAFPLRSDALVPPNPDDPPQQLWLMDRGLRLPVTYQWNISIERAIGRHQAVTLGIVGAEGRDLLKLDRYNISLRDWPTIKTPVNINGNNGYSDYRALQAQFRRRLHDGLQSIVSYTFGRSRDTLSSDFGSSIPAEKSPTTLDYGYSDFDLRHVLTTALTYQLPERKGTWLDTVRNNWGADLMFRARTALPIDIKTSVPFVAPDNESVRPNLVSGEPTWITDSSVPGGRYLNRNAFVAPAPNTQGNLMRGKVRGFSLSQVDLAVRRDVRLRDGMRLQFRAEVFNLLNTPNFLDPVGSLEAADFGQASQMLNGGFGGLNALYQVGGPRSSQITLKFVF